MLINRWREFSRWIAVQSGRMFQSKRPCHRKAARVWTGSRQALPVAFEALETRTMLAGEAFLLHSLPGATKRVYLDFTGHTTSGTSWNAQFTGGADIVSTAFDSDSDGAAFS